MTGQNPRKMFAPVSSIATFIALAALLPATRGSADEEAISCTQPSSSVIERQVTTQNAIRDASIAIDACGRWATAWHDLYGAPNSNQRDVRYLRYGSDCATQPYSGQPDGSPLSKRATVANCVTDADTIHRGISIAMGTGAPPSLSPPLMASWTGNFHLSGQYPAVFHLRMPPSNGTWTFDQATATQPVSLPQCDGPGDREWNTSSISDGINSMVRTSAGTRDPKGGDPGGLLAEKPTPTTLRTCDPECFVGRWAPCISTRFTGESVICWAEAEHSDNPDSVMNIFIAEYTSSGALIPASASVPGFLVNAVDPPDSNLSQESPAVAMVGDKIVVTWVGPDPNDLPNCSSGRHIFAKVMTWNGSTGIPTTQKADFRVDTDQFAELNANVAPNPTVAITLTTQPSEGAGRFIIAWNVIRTRSVSGSPVTTKEVAAQYFDPNGNRLGGQFRLNVANPGFRQLAISGQHTLAYGVQGQVIAVSNNGPSNNEAGIFYTYLPPGYHTQVPTTCSAGDVNGDGLVNGRDIQPFVDYFLNGLPTNVSEGERDRIECAMDCDKDRDIDDCDIPVFIWLLLGLPISGDYALDCNENCIADYIDVAKAIFPSGSCTPTLSCPCEGGDCCLCALVPTAPGPVYVMPDCNENEIDDATDIANETSVDCNTDGVPDECQLAGWDCNSNGVLDACDVDPTDPDGDEVVYDDCNASGIPDECDLELVFLPSYDCNTNGIPDECDIAEESSADCNTNGIPDECDIAAEIKIDENENGIPDDCEEESMMMGSGGGEGGEDSPPASPYDNPAWEDFWQWQSDNAASLAAMSPWDRFKATTDKLQELGLPAAFPWARLPESSP